MQIPESVDFVRVLQLEPEVFGVHLQLFLLLEVDVRVEFVFFYINIIVLFFLILIDWLLTVGLIFLEVGLDHLVLQSGMLHDLLLEGFRRNNLACYLCFRSFENNHEILIPDVKIAHLALALERSGLELKESVFKTFVPIDVL